MLKGQNEERKKELIKCAQRVVEKLCEDLQERLGEEMASIGFGIVDTFRQCFMNTVETTVTCLGDDEIFLITGDIEAMWLRDSSCQVAHLMPFLKEEPLLADMVKGLIKKQFEQIAIDPYANAFNVEPNGACWSKDRTDDNPWDWERKYEIDSLCYPVRLIYQYNQITGDDTVFTEEVHSVLRKIVELWKVEQHHGESSKYYFERDNCPPSDTLTNEGKGTPVAYTGMIWSGFRPSDDACKYGYLVPSNMFAEKVCTYIAEISQKYYDDLELKETAEKLRCDIHEGIEEYAVVDRDGFGEIYAYEVDGFGNVNCMDDANVPSLLSLPWLGCVDKEDERYIRTRSFILSKENPYYYEGKYAKGIGSPHTPKDYIWPIALSMQGLTAVTRDEKRELLFTLLNTDAGTGYMHEGFNCDDPKEFTRPWFAWSNSMFALFVENMFF